MKQKDLMEEFLELKAKLKIAEEERLFNHFLKTGQVLPTTEEMLRQINDLNKLIDTTQNFIKSSF